MDKLRTLRHKEKPIFSKQEDTYIHDVIISAMLSCGIDTNKDFMKELKQKHTSFMSNKECREEIKGVDTFGLVLEALDTIYEMKTFHNMDYREEIMDHGKNYMYGRMVADRQQKNMEKMLEIE